MLQLRPRHLLDGADLGWLKARHHFAVSADGNPAHAPLGPLVVWNDDEIAPGTGFGRHGHRDMEIITYVREGVVAHDDDAGNVGETRAGDVQAMSAGTGIRHAERNGGDGPLRIFQIWLRPRAPGGIPRWGNRAFPKDERAGQLVPLASGFAGDGDALPINAAARVLGATLPAGRTVEHPLGPGRVAYLAPSRGTVLVNGRRVATGDGVAVVDEAALSVVAEEEAEFILVVA